MTGMTAVSLHSVQTVVACVENHFHFPPDFRPQNRNTHSGDYLGYPVDFHSDERRPVQAAVQIQGEQTHTQTNEDVPHYHHTSLVRRKG